MISVASSGGTLRLSTGAVDSHGCRWRAPYAPEGWEGGPVRTVLEPKTAAAGAILAESQRDARSLVLYGSCSGPSIAAKWEALADLEAVINAMVTADGTLTVEEPRSPVVTKTLTVRYSDRLRVEHTSPISFRFQLPLTAVDPVKTVV